MKKFIVCFLISFVCFSIPALAKSQSGIVCVLPISATAVIDEMSGAAPSAVGQPLPRYQVQIGHQAKQPVDHQVIKVFALPLAGRHLVKIFADNQLSHSFYFRFSDFPAAQVLYLSMSEIGYQTWTLRAAPSKKQACV